MGSSAGLNLLLDKYFVDAGTRSWDPHDSPLRLTEQFGVRRSAGRTARHPFPLGLGMPCLRSTSAVPRDPDGAAVTYARSSHDGGVLTPARVPLRTPARAKHPNKTAWP
ncbi:hypothetical protein [Alloactinosynnema sp. L-07]|nr:hypothetical protein [Alloactinosynnema sp. L-07]